MIIRTHDKGDKKAAQDTGYHHYCLLNILFHFDFLDICFGSGSTEFWILHWKLNRVSFMIVQSCWPLCRLVNLQLKCELYFLRNMVRKHRSDLWTLEEQINFQSVRLRGNHQIQLAQIQNVSLSCPNMSAFLNSNTNKPTTTEHTQHVQWQKRKSWKTSREFI